MNDQCKRCATILVPHHETKQVWREATNLVGGVNFTTVTKRTGRILGYGYQGEGHFCSLRCGWRYALDIVRARP